MRKSKMLAKFRNGDFARVCAMGHVLPFYIKYAAHYGFDGIWLDLEHRAMDQREVQLLLALCHANDIDCMVRTPTLEHTKLYRYLEDGATGFLVPLVSTAEAARHLVQAIKYPPIGNRGMDGAGLDAGFGLDAWKADSTYSADANRETFIIVQIETPEAVENLDEIAAVPGVDGLFVGPADLGLRISAHGSTLTIEDAFEATAAAAKKHGKIWSTVAGSPDEIRRLRTMGAQMVPWGGDFALMNVLKQCSEELDEILGD
jgi:2-keto-3-deoxy-L-rhamnonate aldolase RhmA